MNKCLTVMYARPFLSTATNFFPLTLNILTLPTPKVCNSNLPMTVETLNQKVMTKKKCVQVEIVSVQISQVNFRGDMYTVKVK